jgi:HPt (histidine-containing phosphotransfer) domain-containing protein
MTTDFDARMAGLRSRFRERAASSATGLRAALAAGDLAEVVRLAHVLAGSGGLFGYPELGAAASEVEVAAESGDRPALVRLMPELVRLLDEAAQGR